MNRVLKSVSISLVVMGACLSPSIAAAKENPTGREVFEHCNFKYPGDDQRSTLTIVRRDKDGNEKKNIYKRLWKDYKGADGIADKMILYTEYPPDAEGAGFMRWAYTSSLDKNADQWVYLPVLKKIRRVSIRDPGDSFLGSDLTYADISGRDIDADRYKLMQVINRGDQEIFAVESTPKDADNALYSRTISWFLKAKDWDSCVKRQVDFYDRKGEPLKREVIKWQQVKDAWVWSEVLVRNIQTEHSSLFRVTDVKINVGLDDDVFTERALSQGR